MTSSAYVLPRIYTQEEIALISSLQSFGPLFPFPQYTLLNSMLTSIACYVAIALVFIIFAFPETMNHSYLDSSADLLDKLQGILALQDDVLRADPHELADGTPLATKTIMARVGMLTQLQQREWSCYQLICPI